MKKVEDSEFVPSEDERLWLERVAVPQYQQFLAGGRPVLDRKASEQRAIARLKRVLEHKNSFKP